MLIARALALNGRGDDAIREALAAEACAPGQPDSRPGYWADFDLPGSIHRRLRLELIRIASTWPLTADQLSTVPLADWQYDAVGALPALDADRLLSGLLRRRLSTGVVPEGEIRELQEREELAAQDLPRTVPSPLRCHLEVPPLFVTLAWCWLAVGQPDRSFELLRGRRGETVGVGDPGTQRAAALSILQISRRMRVAQPRETGELSHSADREEQAAAWALMALTEPPATSEPSGSTAEALHDWWRSLPVLPEPGSVELKALREHTGAALVTGGSRYRFGVASVSLDREEAAFADPRFGASPIDLRGLAMSGRCSAEQLARVTLRLMALGQDETSGLAGPADLERDGGAWDPAWWRERWSAGLGLRRLAELALDEGELLALRLPQCGIPLLDLAATWFGQAEDPWSALFAGIAGVLARCRAAVPVPEDRIKDLSFWYSRVTGRRTLPTPVFSDKGQNGFTFRLVQIPRPAERSSLSGWLPRLVACLTPSDEGSQSQVTAWLQETLGPLPAELDLADPSRALPRRRSRAPVRPAPAVLKKARLPLEIFTALIAALPLVAVLVLGSYSGYRQILAGNLAVIVALIVVAGTAAVLRWRTDLLTRLWARARARWCSWTTLTLRITPAPRRATPRGDTPVRITLWRRDPRRPLAWLRRAIKVKSWELSLPPLRGYARTAAALPAGLQDELRILAERVAPWRHLRVSLDIEPALERLPWEALLMRPVLTGDQPVPGAVDFWRRASPLPPASARRRRRPHRIIALADTGHGLLVERGWQTLMSPSGMLITVTKPRSLSQAPFPGLTEPDIVHIIGRPVRGRSAVLLQIAERLTAGGTSEEQLREAVVGSGLLEPGTVAELQASLVVVQGAPVETGSRLDTERRDAADLRSWASDVFRCGAAAVISLPSLHPSLAGVVLTEIAHHVRSGIKPASLFAATWAARTAIGTWPGPDSEPAASGQGRFDGGSEAEYRSAELAFDVCLFGRGRPPHDVPSEGSTA
jgi:hypothetical protein